MSINPKYYQNSNGHDLIEMFENNWMTGDQVRGFLAGNVIKYLTRYDQKNGLEDINKALTYLKRLYDLDVDEGLIEDKTAYAVNLSGFTNGEHLTGYMREKSILDMIEYFKNSSNSEENLKEAMILVKLLAKRVV